MGAANILGQFISGALELNANADETNAKRHEDFDNAALADNAAKDAIERGNLEAGKVKVAGGQLLAKQKVAYATSGVDATVGTPADVQAATAGITALDAKTATINAAREAWGFKKQSDKFKQEAELESKRSTSKAWGTVLGGLPKFSGGK